MGRPRKIKLNPRKPLSAYTAFVQEYRPLISSEHPEYTFKELASEVGATWKRLPHEKRLKYIDIAAADKLRYEKEKTAFQEDPHDHTKEGEDGPKRKGPRKKSKLAPKNPLSAYTCFVREVRAQIMHDNPDKSFQDVAAHVGTLWKTLSPEERLRYDKLAEEDKKRYELEKAKFNLKVQEILSLPRGKRTRRRSGPKRAISAYTFYVMENRPKASMENPGYTFKEIAQIIGESWRSLSKEEKEPYLKRAQDDKERFELEKLAFNAP